jgi:hypothetical protein
MNCSVCGSPLLFDRVVFHCECGAYVHAYCANKHILESHRPEMDEGHADLNGDFHLNSQPVDEAAAVEPVAEPVAGEKVVDEDEEVLEPGEEIVDDVDDELEEGIGDGENDEADDEDK